MRSGQVIFFIVAALGQKVNGLAAWVRQAENARSLVKALPCRIVTGRAYDLEVGVAANIDYERIAAGDRKAEKRRLKLFNLFYAHSNMLDINKKQSLRANSDKEKSVLTGSFPPILHKNLR